MASCYTPCSISVLFMVVGDTHVVLMLCFSFVPGLLFYCSPLIHWPLCPATRHHLTIRLMEDHPFSYLLQPPFL